MVTIFVKKYSKRRPLTVQLEGFASETAEQRLSATIAAWPSRNIRFEDDRTVYRYGRLTIVFDLTGKAIEGYSYYACLFAFAPPSEDYPAGRLVWNDTSYSSTTNSRHRYPCMHAAEGMATGTKEYMVPWTDEPQTYTVHAQFEYAMVVDNMPWTCTPEMLLEETRTWHYANGAGRLAAHMNQVKREQRAEQKRDNKIAQGKHLRLVTGGAA